MKRDRGGLYAAAGRIVDRTCETAAEVLSVADPGEWKKNENENSAHAAETGYRSGVATTTGRSLDASGHQSRFPAIPLKTNLNRSTIRSFAISAVLLCGQNMPMLTPRQARVANALAKGATITEAAKSAGLHRATIYKWLRKQEHFQTAIGDARGAYHLALRKELRDLSNTAFATLRSMLTDPKATVAVRQRLALAFLSRLQFSATGPDDIRPKDLLSDWPPEETR